MKRFISFILILVIALSAVPTFAASAAPEVVAEAALLIDMTTGEVLFEKNANDRYYPASTTKMMTCILALENLNTSEETIVNGKEIRGITGDKLDLQPDEKLGIGVMLSAMMVISANDVAVVLANRVAGSVSAFADMMNAKAEELGCKDTHFVNPNGLHDKNHYSTCHDLAKIATYCMQNEVFRRVVARPELTVAPTNKYPYRYLTNTNLLLNEQLYDGCIGIKTGTTTPAGACLVAAATRGETTLLSVVLKSTAEARFEDTKALFDWGFANYQTLNLVDQNQELGTIKVKKGKEKKVELELAEMGVMTVEASANTQLTTKLTIDKNITAPFEAGTVCGKLEVLDGDRVIRTFDVTTKTGVASKRDKTYSPSTPQRTIGTPGIGISITWIDLIKYVGGGGLIILIICFIIYVIYKERQAKKRKARRAARRKEMAEREAALREELSWSSHEHKNDEL